LQQQTFKDFELVCVDDSSTDDSFEILNNIAQADSRIKLFQKPNGGNVAKSWNFVLPYLNGKNIMYMSQDDLMSEDNLEQLYKRQQETGADCVLPDLEYYYESRKKNKRLIGVNGNREIILVNREAVILSLNWKIHGFALWRSSLIKDEYFYEDSFTNDEYLTRKLFLKSNMIAFCKGVFFYRQDNEMAITKTYGLKNYYTVLTNFRIYKLLAENKFKPDVVAKALYDVYVILFSNFKHSSLRHGIATDKDYGDVRSMLMNLYVALPHHSLYHLAKHMNGYARLKMFAVWLLFSNKTTFNRTMSLVHFLNKSNPVKSLFHLAIYSNLFPDFF
jgi:glycosyltransferase involved in cell wall biosynthesis